MGGSTGEIEVTKVEQKQPSFLGRHLVLFASIQHSLMNECQLYTGTQTTTKPSHSQNVLMMLISYIMLARREGMVPSALFLLFHFS